MFEMLLSPRKAEKRSWEMFFVGLFYASLSVLIVSFIFGKDPVLSKYSGILIVTFTVMFSLPFVYYVMKYEEERDVRSKSLFEMLKEHRRAIYMLLWLFVGFIVAFSFWYTVLASHQNFSAQVETYCQINKPSTFNDCVKQYGVTPPSKVTGGVTSKDKLFAIFANNVYVLIFTLVFSLIFGAGAIFVLAWNASVIAAAVVIFAKSSLLNIPLGIARYAVHGLPEIAAYFVAALAGGILSISIIRHDTGSDKFWKIMQDSLNLLVLALVILFLAAILEVYVTPALF